MEKQCVVVGAGHAGGRAVEALKKYNYPGRVVLVGAEASLPMERPPLSKAYLANPEPDQAPPIRDQEWYADNAVELLLDSAATGIDVSNSTVRLKRGREVAWTSLVLATGADVRKISVPGAELKGIHYLRTLDDATALATALRTARRVAVVGGGFIGLEAASVATKHCAVTVLEGADRIIGRAVAPEISDLVENRFRAAGVDVQTSAAVTGFGSDNGRVAGVELGNGSFVVADCVVVGIGVVPNTDIAEDAGIRVENGIVVDAQCRTNVDNIFAVGDVTNHLNPIYGRHVRLESWQNAQNQAIAAARVIAGENFVYSEVPWFWSDQLDFKIQVAGVPDRWDSIVVRGDGAADILLFQVDGDNVVGLQSIGALKDMRRARKLLEVAHSVDKERLGDADIDIKDIVKDAINS